MPKTKVWVIAFWKMDEPARFSSEFEDGAKAADFTELKQSQGYLVNVTTEDRKQSKFSMKKLLKKAFRAIGEGFTNAGGGN